MKKATQVEAADDPVRANNETPRDSLDKKADRRIAAKKRLYNKTAKYKAPKLGLSIPANAISIASSTMKYDRDTKASRPSVQESVKKEKHKQARNRSAERELASGNNMYKSFRTSMSKQPTY